MGSAMRVKAFLLALFVAVLVPAGASAAVHVDPNSPSGQEYALPLNDARGDAGSGHGGDGLSGGAGGQPGGPSGGSAAGATQPPPAFGVGLGKNRAGGRDANGKTVRGGGPQASDGAGGGDGSSPTAVGTRTAASTSAGGLSSTLLFSGLGVGTLVLGAAAGVLLRRRLGRNAF